MHLPKKASVVDDRPVDDGAGKHGKEGHEDGLEAEGERLVSDFNASQSNKNIANPRKRAYERFSLWSNANHLYAPLERMRDLVSGAYKR